VAHQELRFRRFEQVGKNWYRGFTRHQVADSQMQLYVCALRGQAFPGTSGTYAPIALKVVGRDSPTKGWSYVDSYYETKRQIGKARITMISSAKAKGVWGKTDMDGKTIYGPYGWIPANEYVVVAGEDTILDWSCVIIVKFAKPAAGYNPLAVAAVVGTINDRPLNLLSAKKGTMRCIKVVQEQVYLDDLVYLNAYLEYNPKGFDGTVRKGAWYQLASAGPYFFTIGKEWKLKPGADPTLPASYTLVDVPGTESRRYYKTSNFSILNGLMSWEIDR